MVQSAAADVHPPLYFAALHYWIVLAGDSVLSVRFLSVIFGVLAIPTAYLLGPPPLRRHGGLTDRAHSRDSCVQRSILPRSEHVQFSAPVNAPFDVLFCTISARAQSRHLGWICSCDYPTALHPRLWFIRFARAKHLRSYASASVAAQHISGTAVGGSTGDRFRTFCSVDCGFGPSSCSS